MVGIPSLWLPILISAVLVFLVSFIIHSFLKYHQTDFGKLPDEQGVMDALRPFKISPADYVVPRAHSTKEIGSPEFKEKVEKGPVIYMTVLPNGVPSMTTSLIQWFVYLLVVGVFTAYITGRTIGPGAEYLAVFRIAGCTAFIGYALALWQNSIWYKKSWSATIKNTMDGLIYCLVTAGTFGWLWPE